MPGKHSTPPTVATVLAEDVERLRYHLGNIQNRIDTLREAARVIFDFIDLLEACKQDLLACDQLDLVNQSLPWDGKDLLHPDDDDNKGQL